MRVSATCECDTSNTLLLQYSKFEPLKYVESSCFISNSWFDDGEIKWSIIELKFFSLYLCLSCSLKVEDDLKVTRWWFSSRMFIFYLQKGPSIFYMLIPHWSAVALISSLAPFSMLFAALLSNCRGLKITTAAPFRSHEVSKRIS